MDCLILATLWWMYAQKERWAYVLFAGFFVLATLDIVVVPLMGGASMEGASR